LDILQDILTMGH